MKVEQNNTHHRMVRIFSLALARMADACRVHRVGPGPAPNGQRVFIHPHARLVFALSGRFDYQLSGMPTCSVTQFQSGDCLVFPPYCWAQLHAAGERFSRIGVVFLPNTLRCQFVRYSVRQDRTQVYTCHTARGLDPAGDHVLDALGSLPPDETSPMAADLVRALMQDILKHLRETPVAHEGKADHTWQTVNGYVCAHLHHPLSRDQVAQAFGLSRNYISALFRRYADKGFAAYLTAQRMHLAARFLTESTLPVQQVAYQCGFRHAAYFSKTFKRSFHQTPIAYRLSQERKPG